MADSLAPGAIKPCDNQVGGHMAKDQAPDMFTDDQGRFYKPYQKGLRADREKAFYATFWPQEGKQKRFKPAPPIPEDQQPAAMESEEGEFPKEEDVEGLRPFIAKYFGVAEHDGRQFIVLEDMCADYEKPCVIDCKLGFKSVYDWAEPSYIEKNAPKDLTTTQASVGFRISGAQVYKQKDGEMFKTDRQWGKTLTAETIHEAFVVFADNGVIPAEALYRGAGVDNFLSQLKKLEAWAQSQTSFQFYQASVLLMYEGTATGIADAKLSVKLVDFAHTFGASGPAPADPSFLKGLQSLISTIEKLK